jgi:N6-adenosine-specific RNA methylase IME4
VKNRITHGHHWLRTQTEHAILAVRGSPKLAIRGQSNALMAPVREHSRKPEEFYELVESLCPGPRVELFARESRKGWVSWGGERRKFDGSRG